MPNDVTVLIADATRIPGLRADSPISGAVLYFSDANLASALESIRANDPKVIAIESHFVDSGPGHAFVDRLRTLALTGSEIRVLCRNDGNWSTTPLSSEAVDPGTLGAGLNTRRAPRFLVVDPLRVIVDGKTMSFIDLSVLGAQVISQPALRPKQRVKVTLPNGDQGDIKFPAQIAWSLFEKPKAAPAPHYRAGVAFDAAKTEIEEFCRRHCSVSPLPYRG